MLIKTDRDLPLPDKIPNVEDLISLRSFVFHDLVRLINGGCEKAEYRWDKYLVEAIIDQSSKSGTLEFLAYEL